jgi:hypothetical protein
MIEFNFMVQYLFVCTVCVVNAVEVLGDSLSGVASRCEALIRYGMTHQQIVLVSLPVSGSVSSVISCGWSFQDGWFPSRQSPQSGAYGVVARTMPSVRMLVVWWICNLLLGWSVTSDASVYP